MIKTLRITGVLAAILAGVLIYYFVIPIVSDFVGGRRADKSPPPPGVIERFKQQKGAPDKGAENQISPLVKQATAYAINLRGPDKPKPPMRRDSREPGIPDMGSVTPKFQVFATAFFEGNPELSQALIDEPGKGRYWVRQSGMVGHLLIEQVKDGVVVVKNSREETFELEVEKTLTTSPPKGRLPISMGATREGGSSSTLPAPGRTITRPTRTPLPRTPSKTTQSSEPSPREKAADERRRKLENILRSYKTGGRTIPGLTGEESAARVEKLLSSFGSSTVSAEDAKGLTALGETLKDKGQDPNTTSSTSKTDKIEEGAAKREASTPK